MTLPNLITILRLVLVPLTVAAIGSERWQAAFVIFIIAGLSDGIDGFIARHFNMRSELGAYLDAAADKVLLVSIYVTLAIVKVLPGWMAILVVSRDLMIIGAVVLSWLMANPVEIKPLVVSKLNTAAQIALAALVLGTKGFGIEAEGLHDVGIVLVAALTLASAGAYLATWLRHMSED